ncbi:hypothetical protein [Kitasatospora paranensis]
MEHEAFEAIAMTAARENITLELIDGRIGVRPVPDGDHGEIVVLPEPVNVTPDTEELKAYAR